MIVDKTTSDEEQGRRQKEATDVAEAYLEWFDEREEDDTMPLDDVRRHEILMLSALVRDALDREARQTEAATMHTMVTAQNAYREAIGEPLKPRPVDDAEAVQAAVDEVRRWHPKPPVSDASKKYNLLADFAARELLFRGAR